MKLRAPEILQHLLRRYGLLVLLTLLGALAGGAYDLAKTPTYVAKSYVVVTGAQGDSQSAVNFAQAYGRIVTTGPVVNAAAATLGSRDGLSAVTASTSPDAPVIEITATGTGAQHTADVANAMARALVSYGGTRTDSTRVTLSVLAVAAVPTSPASPKPPLEAAIGAAGGLLVGGLAVLAGVGSAARRAGTRGGDGADAGQDAGQHPGYGRRLGGASYPVTQLGQHPAAEVVTWTDDRSPRTHRTRAFAWYAGAGGPDDAPLMGPVADKAPATVRVPVAPAAPVPTAAPVPARARVSVPARPVPAQPGPARAAAQIRTPAAPQPGTDLAVSPTEIIIPAPVPPPVRVPAPPRVISAQVVPVPAPQPPPPATPPAPPVAPPATPPAAPPTASPAAKPVVGRASVQNYREKS